MGVPKVGRGWKLAPSLVAMEAEANRLAPHRRIASDGSIGDQSHQARASDHNPSGGYVDALDLTHDPRGGFDAHAHARDVARNVTNGVERRIKYIISNRQIFSFKSGRWAWRPYSGANGHTQHAHFSIEDSGRFDTRPWFGSVPFQTPGPPPYVPPEEDDMFVRAVPSGRIVHLYGERYRHLNAKQWARRVFIGAKLEREVTDKSLDDLVSDLIKDPT